MTHLLSFSISTTTVGDKPQTLVMPQIDGVPLIDLVAAFETASGWSPAGGYGWLTPGFHCYGSVDEYFLGQGRSVGWNSGKTPLLVCTCEEIGCWPLVAKIEVERDRVVWHAFEQPHRPEWNYAKFGPFHFDREAYEAVIRGFASQNNRQR